MREWTLTICSYLNSHVYLPIGSASAIFVIIFFVGLSYGCFLKSPLLRSAWLGWQQAWTLHGCGIGYLLGNPKIVAECADVFPPPMPSSMQWPTLLPFILPNLEEELRAIRV